MSDNWIVQNLNSALNTWNEKLAEIWTLLTQSPESFKGGTIWSVITGISGALTAIGYGLLVLFFAAGIVKTCGSFTDMKKPEHALKAFIRFALACIIFSVYSASPPAIGDTSLSAVTIVWNYVGELVFNLLVLVGAVKASDRIVKEMMGL